MTNAEIKKLYTKTKKAYEKRTGNKLTWVMNCRQQQLGTATILCSVAWDYDEQVRRYEKHLANFEADWAKTEANYKREAAIEARKNERTPGWWFGENRNFWQELAQPEKLAEKKAQELADRKQYLEAAKASRAKNGDYSATRTTAYNQAQELIDSPEVQSFLKTIGGEAYVDPKTVGGNKLTWAHTEMYVRFSYKATEA